MSEGKSLERLKATRAGHRGVTTKLVKGVDELLDDPDSIDQTKTETFQELLGKKLSVLNALDEEILTLIGIDEIEQEIEETSEVTARIINARKKLQLFSKPKEATNTSIKETDGVTNNSKSTTKTTLESASKADNDDTDGIANASTPPTISNSESNDTTNSGTTKTNGNPQHGDNATNFSNHSSTQYVKPKLPKLTLSKFKGDVTRWSSFWDSFNSTVHDNAGMTKIDKFNYLNSLLEGPAARAIQGLPITSQNYDHAVELLKERFGKPQQIISAHMDEILKIPSATGDRTAPLRFMYDKVSVHVRGLSSLGVSADQYGSLLIPIIMSKLPSEIRLQIARRSSNKVWDMEELLDTIKIEIEAREVSEGSSITNLNAKANTGNSPQRTKPTASTLVASEQKSKNSFQIRCAFCDGHHYSASCSNVTNIDARREKLKESGRCYSCLRKGHQSKNCTSQKKCRRCQGSHHQSICNQEAVTTVQETKESTATNAYSTTETTTTTNPSKSTVLLQTARATARNGNLTMPVRILFDTGSQRSYIRNSVQSRLKLRPTDKETLHLNTFGDSRYKKQECEVYRLTIENRKATNEGAELTAIKFPTICSPLNSKINVNYTHLDGLELADYHTDAFNDGDDIDILIGADQYWNFVTGDIVRGDDGPIAISSKLGWLLSGHLKTTEDNENNPTTNLLILAGERLDYSSTENDNDNLISSLKSFWNTESIGITPLEEKRETHLEFVQDINFKKGRYEVGLPWKDNRPDLGTDYELCHNRLRSLHSKLKKQPELLKEYDKNIKEQLAAGIIETIPAHHKSSNDEVSSNQAIHYIPHHGVVRKDRTTTKLRVVYDGSATTSARKYSLNDCLETGPNYIPHLFSMMVKFRVHRVALVADIEKAFLMIGINERDRDMLRFLWFANATDPNPELLELRFCRLVFGLRPSPAILGATINHHLETHKEKNKETVTCLQNSLYVDDFVSGAETEETAFKLYMNAKNIMAEGGFNLRKWNSNSRTLVQSINNTEVCTTKSDSEKITRVAEEDLSYAKTTVSQETNVIEDKQAKVLGMIWNFETDEFTFNLKELISYCNSLPVTKRSLLKWSAKIFDPLGFFTPFTIKLKNWFQELCLNKVDWDEEMNDNERKLWDALISQLNTLSEIKIQRCYFDEHKRPSVIELHGFSDASERAFAAAVYLRVIYEDGDVSAKLVASKTKVAPIKKQTIPRLELLGATILARLINTITQSLPQVIESTFQWVDSMATLCWITNERQWKPYVQHRVDEIRKLTDKRSWRFCPGKENPADLPSRGLSTRELATSIIWWNGPEFLYLSKPEWPKNPVTIDSETAKEEIVKKPTKVTHSLTTAIKENNGSNVTQIIDCERFGNLKRLFRVTAYVLRFIKGLKEKKSTGKELTAPEIETAETLWIKSIQSTNFYKELECLSASNKHSSSPQYVKQFNLFLDRQKVIKCKGRLHNSELNESGKNPILLPACHYFTKLVIKDCHERVHHSGLNTTLTNTRERFWIIKGRQAVKRVLKLCVTCRKLEGTPYRTPQVPDLPEFRVSEDPPFTYTGVDFAGPLYIKEEKSENDENEKAYVCLFTCASTRAVHLELVRTLTLESFLNAFRRFSSRRGLPARLISDNAAVRRPGPHCHWSRTMPR